MMKKLMIMVAAVLGMSLCGAAAASPEKKDNQETAYDKLFKDKEVKTVEGFMTLHKVEDKVYAEIPENVFKKELLLVSYVSQISDHTDAHPGVNPMVPLKVAFERSGDRLNLVRDKSVSIGDGDPGVELAISRNTIGAIFRSFDILAWNADSTAAVIDLTSLMTGSERLLNPIHAKSEGKYMLMGVHYSHNPEGSYIEDVKAFRNNVMITSTITYDSHINPIYTRHTTAQMDRMFVVLPEKEMPRRETDYRLPVQSIGRILYRHDFKGAQPYYFAQRWRLEPTDQAAFDSGAGSEVKKPIVFYVDTTFTPVLHYAITEGIGEWNKAFEKIGFKNVIQFRDYPSPQEDPLFDPENFDYNVVSFVPSLTSGATVRTVTDPRSGEILRTTLSICYNYITDLPYDILLNTAHANPAARTMNTPEDLLKEQAKYHLMWLTGVDCFGMTYNLTSSAAFPTDSLRSATFTQKYGTTPSMLDRALFNTVAPVDGATQGIRMMPVGLGEYDYFVVDWLYRPFKEGENEKEILKKMVDEKMGDPVYRYEYAKNCPDCGADDVGDDDLKNAGYALENLEYMMANFDKWISDEEDKDYSMRHLIYYNLQRKYKQILTQIATNIYGIKTYQKMSGDPVPSFEYMSRERQEKALDMLWNHLNRDEKFLRDDVIRNYQLDTKDVLSGHNDYLMLLMNTIASSLFAYDGAPSDRMKHSDFIIAQVNRLWEPTREGRELTGSEIYYQNRCFRTLMASSKIADVKVMRPSASGHQKDWSVVDFSIEDKFALADALADELYAQAYDPEDLVSAGNYGEMKKWPVFNVQSTRFVYLQQMRAAYEWMKEQLDGGNTETQQHYRFLTDLYERVMDY